MIHKKNSVDAKIVNDSCKKLKFIFLNMPLFTWLSRNLDPSGLVMA